MNKNNHLSKSHLSRVKMTEFSQLEAGVVNNSVPWGSTSAHFVWFLPLVSTLGSYRFASLSTLVHVQDTQVNLVLIVRFRIFVKYIRINSFLYFSMGI